jgi:hypothetical protein
MVPYPTNDIISVPFLTGQTAHVFLIRQAKMLLWSSTCPVEQQRSEAVSLAAWMHLSPPSIMHGRWPLSPLCSCTHNRVAAGSRQLMELEPLWPWWLVCAPKGLPLTSSAALPCSKWGESETACPYLTGKDVVCQYCNVTCICKNLVRGGRRGVKP